MSLSRYLKSLYPRRERPALVQYWDGFPPAEVAAWMKTWEAAEPEFRLMQFDRARATEFIARELGNDVEAAFLRCKPPAMQADVFRYCALYVLGGVYVDADTMYKGGLRALYVKSRRGILFRRTREESKMLTNSFIAVRKPGDPLMEFAMEEAIHNIRIEKSQNVWDVTGPGIFRRAYCSERRDELFGGFEIVAMHSPQIKQIIAFQKGEYKSGPLDWRRMKDAGDSIFQEA